MAEREPVCDRDCFHCPHPDCILDDKNRKSGYRDPEKRREYQKAWRARNPELRKEYQREYYKRHREEILEKERKKRMEKKAVAGKVC